ncbi:hypothetical protein B0H11DRAFT_1029677 [Mycena galericulata]|nr:hypothetical protein B0H11DRAFT_1029677 [Mycena galericulata]
MWSYACEGGEEHAPDTAVTHGDVGVEEDALCRSLLHASEVGVGVEGRGGGRGRWFRDDKCAHTLTHMQARVRLGEGRVPHHARLHHQAPRGTVFPVRCACVDIRVCGWGVGIDITIRCMKELRKVLRRETAVRRAGMSSAETSRRCILCLAVYPVH